MISLFLVAQAAQDLATGAVWGSVIAAISTVLTLAINTFKEDRKDRRLHERLLERIRASDRCSDCAAPRDEWIVKAIARYPDLGPAPAFPACDEVPDEES